MGIVYRQSKGEPLTIEEMDGNFSDIDQRLKYLETTPALAEGVGKIVQAGDEIIFEGTFGTVLGKAILPKVFPNPRGHWEPAQHYVPLDWVQVKQDLYTCVKPHTSTTFDEDKGNWELIYQIK